jgi:hypothetical protein
MPLPLEIYTGGQGFGAVRLYFWRGRTPAPINHTTLRPVKRLAEAPEVIEHWAGMIEGTVTKQGVPAQAQIVALDSKGLKPKQRVESDQTTGHFRLYPLVMGPRQYLILAQDADVRFDIAAHDGIKPVPWEDEP